jgi:cytochrome c oxidase assembly factor CtaG
MERNQIAIRVVIMVLLLCFISTITLAQKTSPDPLYKEQPNFYRNKAVNTRTTGMIMTLAGLPVYVTGVFLLINYALETSVEDRGGFEPKLYTAMTIGGAISSIVGVNLWKAGSRKRS